MSDDSSKGSTDMSTLESTVDDCGISYRLSQPAELQPTHQPVSLAVTETVHSSVNSRATDTTHSEDDQSATISIDANKQINELMQQSSKDQITENIESTKNPPIEPIESTKYPSSEPTESCQNPSIKSKESSCDSINEPIASANDTAAEYGTAIQPLSRANSAEQPNVEALLDDRTASSDLKSEQGAQPVNAMQHSLEGKWANTTTTSHIKQLSLLTKLVIPKPSGVQSYVPTGKTTASKPSPTAASVAIEAATATPSRPNPTPVDLVRPSADPAAVLPQGIESATAMSKEDESPPPKKLSVAERIKSLESNIQRKK